MQLTEEHQKITMEKINQMWKGSRACSICTAEKWTISDKIFQINQFGAVDKGNNQIIPVITVTCTNCGNIYLFNAFNLGYTFNKKTEETKM